MQLNLNIGEVKSSKEPALISVYGLGSCVAVFLHDLTTKVGGGAHIMLSSHKEGYTLNDPLHYAEGALTQLIEQLQKKSGQESRFRAKIIGGANVLRSNENDIGKKNIAAVKDYLVKNRIYIAANDIGGHFLRTGLFETHSGRLKVVSPSEIRYI
ncbi:MAG: chemotaxis protein CheD [Cyclobacteriaceae bacterium]|nr:chemotaxis protein CheD [Cyclobacteriaceae bacterium]